MTKKSIKIGRESQGFVTISPLVVVLLTFRVLEGGGGRGGGRNKPLCVN